MIEGKIVPLKQYNKKRNFKKTIEPKGKVSKRHKYLFVVQKHASRHLHYDFRLEMNGVLLSWAVPKGPSLDPSIKRLAVQVEDHPVSYGHFEGVIPEKEYGAGVVMLWDIGTWTPEDEDPGKAYKKGHIRFSVKGKKLNGLFSLVRIKTDDKAWLLIKTDDKYAKPISQYDVLEKKPKGVLSNMTMDQIARKFGKQLVKKNRKTKDNITLSPSKMPTIIHPQLATLIDAPPESDKWLHELKFDGYRIIAFKTGKTVKLMTRNQNDFTQPFKKIADQIKKLPVKNLILDGEVVLLDKNNKSNFQLLQNSLKDNKDHHFVYFVFDVIYYDKYDLMVLALLQRKEMLSKIVGKDNKILRLSSYTRGHGKEIYAKSCELGMEGIVSKEIDSHYEEKRTKTWLKIKCIKRQEFVIGGYTKPKGSRGYFGALLLGVYNENEELVYCGNVGTGFTQDSLADIFHKLKRYEEKASSFSTKVPGVKQVKWVKPKWVCEVEFTEWTQDGMLRHPSFKGLRMDKPAKKINKDTEMSIKKGFLTNPDKALYPEDGITKEDLLDYYQKIHKWILPYIINRPLSLLRCPDNYNECFYQKHLNKFKPEGVETISIKEKSKRDKYIYIKNLRGLLSLVQLGVLEIHPWGSSIKDVNHPDMMTFDLDPAPEVPWKKVVAAAKLLKTELAKLKLKSFVKSTGGKGLHVVVPIAPNYTWEQVKTFSHAFVKYIVMNHPDDYVGSASKVKRKGKIFIDYLRNQKGATAIAPYSTRARAGAPVAVPLAWEELSNRVRDNGYTILTLPERLKKLKKDPWKGFLRMRQVLPV